MSIESFIQNPLLVDGVFVLLLGLFIYLKAKKGLYKSILPLIILIVSGILAWSFAKAAAPTVSNFVYSSVEEKVLQNANLDKIDTGVATSIMDAITGTLPGNLGNFFQKYVGEDKIQEMTAQFMEGLGLHKSLTDIAKEEGQNLFFKTFNGFVQLILFLILWLLLDLILKLVGLIISGLFEAPGIRGVNHLGGAVIGALEFLLIFWIIVKITDNRDITVLHQMAEGTKLFKYVLALF